jgi:hypothetical protein
MNNTRPSAARIRFSGRRSSSPLWWWFSSSSRIRTLQAGMRMRRQSVQSGDHARAASEEPQESAAQAVARKLRSPGAENI